MELHVWSVTDISSSKSIQSLQAYQRSYLPTTQHQLFQMFPDLCDYRYIFFICFPGWVFQSPVIIECSDDIRASDTASHGNRNIRFRDIINRLGILTAHIDPERVPHDSDRIWINLFLRQRPGKIELISIGCHMLCQCFCDLASASIVGTDKSYFFSCHMQTASFVLLTIFISFSIACTSARTPASVISIVVKTTATRDDEYFFLRLFGGSRKKSRFSQRSYTRKRTVPI